MDITAAVSTAIKVVDGGGAAIGRSGTAVILRGGVWHASHTNCMAYVPLSKEVPCQIRLNIPQVSTDI